jgi:aspartyl-tRNA(Asn)/glutamyl-tRNA(Gln) amidotransferase subunit A
MAVRSSIERAGSASYGAVMTVERALSRATHPDAAATMLAVTADRAVEEEAASAARRRRGASRSPVDGQPIVWKDLFDVAGTTTTAGSAVLTGGPVAESDSALVRRAADVGLVTIGKTNLSEFAFSGLGINQHFGTPANPLGSALVPGGSSSGSAVAVASGIVPFAVGTDTSGSVRVPAAFTGCVGFRASTGRYGPHDFVALSPTLDSVGLFARTVADVGVLDAVLAGVPAPRCAEAPTRAVVAAGEWLDDCDPGVRAAFLRAVDGLRGGGVLVDVREFSAMAEAQRLMDVNGTIVGADACTAHAGLLESPDIEAATRRRLRRNAGSEAAVGAVRAAMPRLRRLLARELDGAVLLCPTVRHAPPRVEALLASESAYDAVNATTLRTTMVLSYLGTCGVSVPLREGARPTGAGLLVSGCAGTDSTTLAHAARIEETLRLRA